MNINLICCAFNSVSETKMNLIFESTSMFSFCFEFRHIAKRGLGLVLGFCASEKSLNLSISVPSSFMG